LRRHHPAQFFMPVTASAWRRVPEDDAVGKHISESVREGVTFGPDTIETEIRERVREVIQAVVNEELEAALGAGASSRAEGRQGYRHGTRPRTVTSSLGPTTIEMPRARLRSESGSREWRSNTIPRYQRRTARVDEAILGLYLAGANTRRVRGALAPLLRDAPMSKDAVSRLVGRLADDFNAWSERDLASEQIRYLLQDGWFPKVRIGKRRVVVPVLVSLGVKADGKRVVLDMRLAGEESAASWGEVVASLVRRNLGMPKLALIDGNPGMHAALLRQWPGLAIQRCTVHKLRNLESKTPVRFREELREDYRRMIYAESAAHVQKARAAFIRKWKLRCPAVIVSLDEAGDELFTFLRFPASQWKALRTTNALERINEEFRRRTKTQSSLPSSDAVLLLLFGLLRSGAVKLRALDGWKDMPKADQEAA
jgi:putative transposase